MNFFSPRKVSSKIERLGASLEPILTAMQAQEHPAFDALLEPTDEKEKFSGVSYVAIVDSRALFPWPSILDDDQSRLLLAALKRIDSYAEITYYKDTRCFSLARDKCADVSIINCDPAIPIHQIRTALDEIVAAASEPSLANPR
jgi:hypothetical protein